MNALALRKYVPESDSQKKLSTLGRGLDLILGRGLFRPWAVAWAKSWVNNCGLGLLEVLLEVK